MLMCPAASLFGSRADDDPALGPVGLYLQQNDYSIIFMQISPEEKQTGKVTRPPTGCEGVISFL